VLYYASETTKVENAVAKLPSARFYNSGALQAAFSAKDSIELPGPVGDSSSNSGFSSSNGASDAFGSGSFKREASDLGASEALTERDYSTSISSQGKQVRTLLQTSQKLMTYRQKQLFRHSHGSCCICWTVHLDFSTRFLVSIW